MFVSITACRQTPDDKVVEDTDDSGILDSDSGDTDSGDTDTDLPEDVDADGFSVAQGDCDDAEPAVNPGADEVCDGVDQDCDGLIDEGVTGTFYGDVDGDGFGDPTTATESCEGAVSDATDCDDSRADVNPAATEVCDGADNDCDDAIDEEGLSVWYADTDGDGYGDVDSGELGCAPGDGRVANHGDCDDTDGAVSPTATEICDRVDNNCDGTVDEGVTTTWYIDYDGDGYGSDTYLSRGCTAPAGYVATNDDCDDFSAAVSPAAIEACNGIDDDCDGTVDEPDASDASTWYIDADGDGWGDSTVSQIACDEPVGYTASLEDCDDTDPEKHPDAIEVCSATIDQDCDGIVPEMCSSCLAYLEEAGSGTDGLYAVDLDGSTGALAPLDVWCDMTTDGGGWTLIQRTVWDWGDSSQLDTGYADWYGLTLGTADPGYTFRLAGEAWPLLDVDREVLTVQWARDLTTEADCDPLYYEGTNTEFTVSGTEATVSSISASIYFTNSTALSTADSGASSDCVNLYDAVPWFYSSCCTTCPTFKGGYWLDDPHPMASYVDVTPDLYGAMAVDVCPSGAAVVSSGYEGVNTMEFYLR